MGVREGIRATAEIQALGSIKIIERIYETFKEGDVSKVLEDRDKPFGDYREKD